MPLLKLMLIRYGKKKINNINLEFKKECLIKALNKDGKLIDIFYNIARGYFGVKEKEIKNER